MKTDTNNKEAFKQGWPHGMETGAIGLVTVGYQHPECLGQD